MFSVQVKLTGLIDQHIKTFLFKIIKSELLMSLITG